MKSYIGKYEAVHCVYITRTCGNVDTGGPVDTFCVDTNLVEKFDSTAC